MSFFPAHLEIHSWCYAGFLEDLGECINIKQQSSVYNGEEDAGGDPSYKINKTFWKIIISNI